MKPRGHVTEQELIDLADGCASVPAQAHAGTCPVCRERVASLHASIALAHADAVPEPSPLFWDHFSARVSEAIRQEPDVGLRRERQARWNWWVMPGVAAAALVFVVAVWPVARSGRIPNPPAAAAAPPAAAVSAAGPDDREVPGEAEGSWEMVAALTGESIEAGEELPTLEPAPGTAERAVAELSGDEQRELARLLEAELTRPPG
jgi:hypothetical protein